VRRALLPVRLVDTLLDKRIGRFALHPCIRVELLGVPIVEGCCAPPFAAAESHSTAGKWHGACVGAVPCDAFWDRPVHNTCGGVKHLQLHHNAMEHTADNPDANSLCQAS